MLFKVANLKQGNIIMTAQQLIETLLDKHLKVRKEEHEYLAVEFAQLLEKQQILHTTSIVQIILMSIALGYYLRVFMDKNDVEIEHTNDRTTDQNGNASSSTSSGS